jgi:hypothetical protein
VFASSGQKIYRRVVSGTSPGSWASLANLDATQLDVRSDLDCSSNANTVHIVATGLNPVGAYMHAFGFGTAYNPFVRELSANNPSTFAPPGASVAAFMGSTDNEYQMAAAAVSLVWVDVQPSTPTTTISADVGNQFTSAPDITMQHPSGYYDFQMVAFLSDGTMAYHHEARGMGAGASDAFSSPPTSTTYSYSPTLCVYDDGFQNDLIEHVAVVAGGKLYYAHEGSINNTTFSTSWEVVPDVHPASSPDCVVTSDNTVHIVFLTAAGTIAHVYRTGVSGSWTTQDLGGF